ncbi:MAG: hypothetical protein ACPHYH_06490 [Flavobacteriaceae bacterium]
MDTDRDGRLRREEFRKGNKMNKYTVIELSQSNDTILQMMLIRKHRPCCVAPTQDIMRDLLNTAMFLVKVVLSVVEEND